MSFVPATVSRLHFVLLLIAFGRVAWNFSQEYRLGKNIMNVMTVHEIFTKGSLLENSKSLYQWFNGTESSSLTNPASPWSGKNL